MPKAEFPEATWRYDGPIGMYAKEIHDTAVSKGWWPDEGRAFSEVTSNIHDEVSEAWREWVHGHDVAQTYYTMHIEPYMWDRLREEQGTAITELLERAAERFMRFAEYVSSDGSEYRQKPPEPSKDDVRALVSAGILEPHGIPTELADIIIRCLDIFAAYELNPDEVIMEKMEYNKTRKHKHGGKRA